MPLVRVRQHVNPLSNKYQVVTAAPNWAEIYQNLEHPLHLDIGCARGQFLLKMAKLHPEWNFLGVEIREPLVIRANEICAEMNLTNIHFLFCNINTSLSSLLEPGSIAGATIQFPDPWFKRRHQKRRVVQPSFLQQLSRCIQPNGFLFIQSDVLEIALEMKERIRDHSAFIQRPDSNPWLARNPFQVSTEREIQTLNQNKPVYRCWFDHLPS